MLLTLRCGAQDAAQLGFPFRYFGDFPAALESLSRLSASSTDLLPMIKQVWAMDASINRWCFVMECPWSCFSLDGPRAGDWLARMTHARGRLRPRGRAWSQGGIPRSSSSPQPSSSRSPSQERKKERKKERKRLAADPALRTRSLSEKRERSTGLWGHDSLAVAWPGDRLADDGGGHRGQPRRDRAIQGRRCAQREYRSNLTSIPSQPAKGSLLPHPPAPSRRDARRR